MEIKSVGVVGCGLMGHGIAQVCAQKGGWDVTVVDEDEDALGRLGQGWRGGFVVGHGMDVAVLDRAKVVGLLGQQAFDELR